jgi:hypothetical protein
MKSLNELNRDISAPLNNLEPNRLNDLRVSVTELANALDNRDQALKPEEIAQARLRLAACALRLSQKTIPMLGEISGELLEMAGSDAIRTACSPIQRIDAPPLPSEFTLPAEFGGIVDRAKAAIRKVASS